MDRLQLFFPIIISAGYFLVAFFAYGFLTLVGKRPPKEKYSERGNAFDFLIQFFLWVLSPLERAVVASRLRPDHLTVAALAVSLVAGITAATSHLATTFWLYIAAGALDILDGRLARANKLQSRAGAFLDSVSDRWAELFVLSGFAWLLRDSLWLAAALSAIAGSVLVSYTRARGEGLGINLSAGLMQRGERIALVAIATLVTAYFDAASNTASYGVHVIGVALALTGIGSLATALGRFIEGYRALKAQEEAPKPEKAASKALPPRVA